MTNENLGRDAHWFDGDGMLSGVAFRRRPYGVVEPAFVNQYILTDVFISSLTTPTLRTPILPSIATLVNPLSSLIAIILRIFRTILLVALSHLPGSCQAIKKISVANTSILYHDGRALATCESGPPMRVSLPGLETIGWYNGQTSENEAGRSSRPDGEVLGGEGPLGWMKEWTTAHPRVDPKTDELLMFHSTFAPPYVHYSIVPSAASQSPRPSRIQPPRLNAPIPGIASPKMMHDFGVSATHSVIMDLPLSLDPLNLARNQPVVSYDPTSKSRFGVFPRHHPSLIRWFETSPCCIFHTANTWDTTTPTPNGPQVTAINMLACRLTSASLVFSAGDIAAPVPTHPLPAHLIEEEQCRLYYYQFPLTGSRNTNRIAHQWSLTALPFEFPTLSPALSMSEARFIYGCSSASNFSASLGRAVKIDALVKVDVLTLIARGLASPPTQIRGCVDTRSSQEILASTNPDDPIRVFKMPEGWYAQEASFVPRKDAKTEDDGWLLTYVFDESQLDERGEAPPGAKSQLWVIDAKNMKEVVCKVLLGQRVPYGLHGRWFSEEEIGAQRAFEGVRHLPMRTKTRERGVWLDIRHRILEFLG